MIGERVIGAYTNGNYKVLLGEHGTKLRYNDADHFDPVFPESIDCKISNKCNMGCAFCHENSCGDGDLANLNHPIFDSLHPFTELALGGGNILEHPNLVPFLERMRRKGVICNITLHLTHFEENASKIKYWHDAGLVHGVGVSVNQVPTDYQLALLRTHSDFVVHCIAGVIPQEAIVKMYGCGLKLLILGYKDFKRGHTYLEAFEKKVQKGISDMTHMLPEMRDNFKLISFDNLALEQLNMRNLISQDEWDMTYMGEDGHFTMYLDMVREEYAKSSTSERKPLFSDNINEVFARVRKENE